MVSSTEVLENGGNRGWNTFWCYSLAGLGHGTLTPRTSVQIRVAPFCEDVRVVKESDLRSLGASLVGSIPTLRIG